MPYPTKKEHSQHPQNNKNDSIDQSRRIKHLASSRVQPTQYTLRFDINTLLSLFNEMEVTGTGELPKRTVIKLLDTLCLYNQEHLLKAETYSFQHFLSLLGQIEVPNQPSVYVLSFVKILVNYRNKCLANEEEGLEEAKAVQEKIRAISQSEIERQKARIKHEHSKIYEQMQKSQYKQFISFEQEWSQYLREFREESAKKIQETKYLKKSKLIEEQNKYLDKNRRKNVITSPWLRELTEKKKWLISDKKFDEAIKISNEINREKFKINELKEENKEITLHKKLQKLSTQTNRYLGAIQKNYQFDFNRLLSKKKEGQSIMKIRMKKLREEANRKLSQHYRSEINRLRSSFYLVANH